jgi:hypothetical protein
LSGLFYCSLFCIDLFVTRFDKFIGNEFERTKYGPKGVGHAYKDVGSRAMQEQLPRTTRITFPGAAMWLYKKTAIAQGEIFSMPILWCSGKCVIRTEWSATWFKIP